MSLLPQHPPHPPLQQPLPQDGAEQQFVQEPHPPQEGNEQQFPHEPHPPQDGIEQQFPHEPHEPHEPHPAPQHADDLQVAPIYLFYNKSLKL